VSANIRAKTQSFCRNEYNVTGLCSRQSCPLLSKYATVREQNGILYLYIKTPERMHSPAKWWEKIKLSQNYETALKQVERLQILLIQIDERLLYYPTFLTHKCKQRLTKLTQYLIRSRQLMLAPGPKITTRMAPKRTRREETKERKALAAARLEKQIENELVSRLKSGNYTEDMLNVNEEIWKKVLDQRARADRGEPEEEEEDQEGIEDVEFVSDEEGLESGEDEFDDWLTGEKERE